MGSTSISHSNSAQDWQFACFSRVSALTPKNLVAPRCLALMPPAPASQPCLLFYSCSWNDDSDSASLFFQSLGSDREEFGGSGFGSDLSVVYHQNVQETFSFGVVENDKSVDRYYWFKCVIRRGIQQKRLSRSIFHSPQYPLGATPVLDSRILTIGWVDAEDVKSIFLWLAVWILFVSRFLPICHPLRKRE